MFNRTYKVYVRIQSFWRAISATLWPSIQMFSLWVVILLQRCFLGICTVWEGSTIGFDSCPLSSQKVSSQYPLQVNALHPFIFIHSLRECNQSEGKIESQNLEVAIRDVILPPKMFSFR